MCVLYSRNKQGLKHVEQFKFQKTNHKLQVTNNKFQITKVMNLLPYGAWRVAHKKQTHMNKFEKNESKDLVTIVGIIMVMFLLSLVLKQFKKNI